MVEEKQVAGEDHQLVYKCTCTCSHKDRYNTTRHWFESNSSNALVILYILQDKIYCN